MTGALRPVPSHAELLDLTGGDPYVRLGIPDPLPTTALLGTRAVAVERHGWRHGFVVLPLPGGGVHDVANLLVALRDEGHLRERGVRSLTVPQPYAALLPRLFELGPGGDWEWMWTTEPPQPVPGEERLVPLDDDLHARELEGLSRAHSPRGEGDPGSGTTLHWLGVRDARGALVAAGGLQRLASGAPHLAGIVVATPLRGAGLGAAVSAGLTRLALTDSGVSTLGMYSDNAPARRLYRRLGYRTAYGWSSRRLPAARTDITRPHRR